MQTVKQEMEFVEAKLKFTRTVMPGVWALLAAVILALILALGWDVSGMVEAVDAAGAVQEVHLITFVTNERNEKQEEKNMSEEIKKNNTINDDELDAVVGGLSPVITENGRIILP